jgi:hypothetical protein
MAKSKRNEHEDSVREVQSQMVDLQDRRAAFLSNLHENRRSLDERAFYPAHDKRAESPEYSKIHKQMVKVEDLPCLVCGVRNSTLKDPAANAYGAKQMETHHHVIEWALANAIDLEKFKSRVLSHLVPRNPQKYGKKDPRGQVMLDKKGQAVPRDFSDKDVRDWVDHDRDNLWVLCDVHHRHKWLGIHAISGPIWGPQDILRDDFQAQVRKALTRAGARTAKGATKPTG